VGRRPQGLWPPPHPGLAFANRLVRWLGGTHDL